MDLNRLIVGNLKSRKVNVNNLKPSKSNNNVGLFVLVVSSKT